MGKGRLEPRGRAALPPVPRDARARQLDPPPGHSRRVVATGRRPRRGRGDRREPFRGGVAVRRGQEDAVKRRDAVATQPHRSTWSNGDRKSTRLNSSHANISYAVFCLKNKDAVDGALDLADAGVDRGDGGGDGEAEVVVAMRGENYVFFSRDGGPPIYKLFPVAPLDA